MASMYRVGVIGRTGRGDYGHGIDVCWKDVPQTQVVAVADEHEGGRAKAAKATGAKTAYADYREMLEKESLDIVGVGPRWIDQHHEIVTACLVHGCHVYMEKPFVRSLDEADAIVKLCEMKHLKLAIAHTNRYSPVVAAVQKLIAAGELGDILEYRGRGKEDAKRGGAEDLWVLGTHMLDLMRMFAGDATQCFATVTNNGKPIGSGDIVDGSEGIGPLAGDAVDAVYTLPKGAKGYFASHRGAASNPSRFGLQILGTKGIVFIPSGYLVPAFYLKDGSWSPGRSGAKWQTVTSAGIDRPETLQGTGLHFGNIAAVKDLIGAIEKDRQPLSNVYDGRAAVEMIAACFESQRIRKPVAIPLVNRRNPLTMLDS
jgi:predicted dehydrogenase